MDDLEMIIRSILDLHSSKVLKGVFEDSIASCPTLSISDGNRLARE
jgi:hypothetical protein